MLSSNLRVSCIDLPPQLVMVTPMTPMSVRPVTSEYAPHQAAYIETVPSGDIISLLRQNGMALDAAFASVSETRADYRYAEDKWSVRQVGAHLVDGERILAYRALRVARGDATSLPGYDGNAYVRMANAERRLLVDLRAELRCLRDSAVYLYASLPAEAWTRVGLIDGKAMSVRAIAYVTLGHAMHHLRSLADQYGVHAP